MKRMRTNFFFFGTKRIGTANALTFGLAMIFAVLLLSGLQSTTMPAHAATTFTVNSTADTGDATPDGTCDTCTLREAIQEANFVSGADTINFNIPGGGPHTISPGSELPPITKQVTIDGYTQPGASENTIPLTQAGTNAVLKIELHGAGATNYCSGLRVTADASNVVIRGLVINNFEFCGAANSSSAPGILLSGTGHKVEGNFIGTDVTGTGTVRNARGVILSDADGSTIGGTSAAARNLLSGNLRSGVDIFSGSGNTIQGNLIGPDKNGNPLVNSNAIDDGVQISSGTGNRILSNSIFENGRLGIDLNGGSQDTNGVTTNDGDDPTTSKPDPDKDTGPNSLQNYPVITSAQTFGSFTSINGTLESTPSTRKKKSTFIIQFFRSPSADSPSGYGEGKTFLGEIQVKTDRQGEVKSETGTFGFAPFQTVPVGQFITATATNKKTGDTSEFSQAERVEPPVIGGP
jgi:CSLREA domain-containing protein